jgi:hypothetical protein
VPNTDNSVNSRSGETRENSFLFLKKKRKRKKEKKKKKTNYFADGCCGALCRDDCRTCKLSSTANGASSSFF